MPNFADLWRDFSAVFPIIVTIETSRYVFTAALASLVIWLFWNAWFRRRKIQVRRAEAKDYRREVLASLRTALVFALTGYGMHLANGAGWLTIYEDFSVRGAGYFAVTLLLMIVAQDAYFYWTHRAMHHPRLFRLFHRTHHKSKTPTPWTAYAFDAPEAIVMVAFVPLWAKLVPMHDAALFAFVTWQIVRNVMGHAGVEMFPVSGRPSRFFGWFNTTTHHDLHHQDGRSNYGLYFSWWDRWMGTEHPEYQARVAEVADRAREGRVCIKSSKPAKIAAGIVAASFFLVAMMGDARAELAPDILDDWATEGFSAVVRLEACESDPALLCGRLTWVWDPDDVRPDSIGEMMLRDFEWNGTAWKGGVLMNPEDGRTYRGSIRPDGDLLRLKGCSGPFCKGEVWRRLSTVPRP